MYLKDVIILQYISYHLTWCNGTDFLLNSTSAPTSHISVILFLTYFSFGMMLLSVEDSSRNAKYKHLHRDQSYLLSIQDVNQSDILINQSRMLKCGMPDLLKYVLKSYTMTLFASRCFLKSILTYRSCNPECIIVLIKTENMNTIRTDNNESSQGKKDLHSC